MKILSVVLSALTLAFVVSASNLFKTHTKNNSMFQESKIVGGNRVYITKVPWIVSITNLDELICSGNLIHYKIALTCAHCMLGFVASDLQVRSGSNFVDQHGHVIHVLRVLMHPQYAKCEACFDFDIGLLFLANSATAPGLPAKTITLWNTDTTFPSGTLGTLCGWGDMEDGGKPADWLRGVVVPIVSRDDCVALHGPHGSAISTHHICAGYSNGGKDGCNGDSGGGLVISEKLAGIYNFGHSCAKPNSPSMYISIPAFRNWIKEETGLAKASWNESAKKQIQAIQI